MGRVWSSGVRAMGVVEFAMMQYVEVDYSEVYGTSQEHRVLVQQDQPRSFVGTNRLVTAVAS